MSSLPDARFDALAEALRAARPVAGDGLRTRVAALGELGAAEERSRPSRRPRWHVPWRAALVAAPIVVAAAAIGMNLDGRPSGGDEAESDAAAVGTVPSESGGVRGSSGTTE